VELKSSAESGDVAGECLDPRVRLVLDMRDRAL
jgi:hypothetical protein